MSGRQKVKDYLDQQIDVNRIIKDLIKKNKELANPILHQINQIESYDVEHMKKVLRDYGSIIYTKLLKDKENKDQLKTILMSSNRFISQQKKKAIGNQLKKEGGTRVEDIANKAKRFRFTHRRSSDGEKI